MKRWLIRIVWSLLALLVLIIPALLAFLLATEPGSRWTLTRASQWAPGELQIGQIDGTLLRGVTLTDTRYRHPRVDFQGQRLALAVNPLALLQGSLSIVTLDGEQLRLEVLEADPPAEQPAGEGLAGLPDINLPLRISTPRAELRDLTLVINGQTQVIDRIQLAGHASGSRVSLQQLRVTSGDYQVAIGGELNMEMPWQLDAWLDWQAPLPAAAAEMLDARLARGDARLRGDLAHLDIHHRLRAPARLDSEGWLALIEQPVGFNLAHQWQALSLILPDGRKLQLDDGRLQTDGNTDAYQLLLHDVTTRLAELPPLQIDMRASGDGNQLTLDQAGIQGEHGQIDLRGQLIWSPELSWQGELQARQLDPAFLALVAAEVGDDTTNDTADDTTADNAQQEQNNLTRALEQLSQLAPLNLDIHASGDRNSMSVSKALIDSDPGHLQVSGSLSWSPAIRWQADILAEQFDPSLIHPEINGRINLDANSSGDLSDPETPELGLLLRQLDGQLRDQPIDGAGHLQLKGRETLDADIHLRLASTDIHLAGHWGERPDLQLTVNAEQLESLWPELAGHLSLDARLHGSRDIPLLEGQAQANNLVFRDYRVDDARVQIDARQQPRPGMTLALEISSLRQADRLLLSDANLHGSGHLDDHRLAWQLTYDDEQLSGSLIGTFAEQQWLATLQTLTVQGPLSGAWQLTESAEIRISAGESGLTPLCLLEDNRQARLCGDFLRQGAHRLDANLQLTDVPLAPVAMLLPTPARIDGMLNAEAQLRQDSDGRRGQLLLDAGSGSALLEDNGDGDYRIPWQLIRAEATLKDQQLAITSRIELDANSQAEGRLDVQLDGAASRLDGQISSRLDDLRWLELLVPRLRHPEGRLRGDLSIGGSFEAPTFAGEISLADGASDVPELGIELRDIHLRAHGDAGGTLRMEGGLRSGPGELRVDGELDSRTALPWPVRLNISGSDVLVAQRPDARILLDPDLQLTLDGTRLTVRGEVLVPSARLNPRQLPQQAVSLSRDVQLLNEEALEQPSPWQVDTDIRVQLGDEVQVDGFGLNARFAGAVRIQDRPQRPVRLTGEVRIEEGRYRAYGQNLRVERGRLLFEGPPDNPGLDIVAVRVIAAHNVRAGLEIGGTLRDPRSRVFSQPAMEESEAMAWLLTGRPLSGASDAEGSAILQAITLYGIEQGDFITDSVGNTLGLEVGVDTEGEFEDTALMLGRQISSRLYLRYSVGLFESLSSVMLRYTLSRTLSLETRSSSEAQSVDLIYRRER